MNTLNLFDSVRTGRNENIEVLDGSTENRPVFSPPIGTAFMKDLNSVFDWKVGDKLDMVMGDVGRINSSIGSNNVPSRPVSQR